MKETGPNLSLMREHLISEYWLHHNKEYVNNRSQPTTVLSLLTAPCQPLIFQNAISLYELYYAIKLNDNKAHSLLFFITDKDKLRMKQNKNKNKNLKIDVHSVFSPNLENEMTDQENMTSPQLNSCIMSYVKVFYDGLALTI